MDQQVFMDLETFNNIRHMQQQNSEVQQQFQPQGISIMSGGDQKSQDSSVLQSDNILYSPMKQNEQNQQFITQDDSMQNHFLIQSPSRTQQQPQVFYTTNISPQNHHNIIAQQAPQKLVLQAAPKVVVQRNTDLLQTPTNLPQIIDQQNQQTIQYHYSPQIDQQGQTQQLVIQQQSPQIKQTIYPQQGNQVVSQPHYFQLQPIQQQNIVPQGAKIVMQSGNQLRYSFIPKSQQQVQQIAVQNQQTGQIMQINQQPQIQQQSISGVRQFRPKMLGPNVRVRVGSPILQQQQQQQLQVQTSVIPQRVRSPRPRFTRPQQSPQTPVQSNNNQQIRPQTQQKMVYFLQTNADGTSVLLPHPQYANNTTQQSPQAIRVGQHKILMTSQTQQPQQQQQQQYQEEVTQQPQQHQSHNQTEGINAPTTSTFTPKKDGDCGDLEDSITATAISKSSRSEPPPLQPQSGNPISAEEYKKRAMQHQNSGRVGIVRPITATGNQLKTPTKNPALQVIRQRPSPRGQFQQPGLTQELEVSERESAKMLVILDNGEQRLITFTLPKETCTVQELLEQVGIQVGADSNIECIENPGSEIDYIVKVGNFASRDTTAMTKAAENHIRQQHQRQLIQNQRNSILQQQSQQQTSQPNDVAKAKSPDLPPPKYVAGFYAVCSSCGLSGADHAKCERCHRIFTEEPKTVRMPPNLTQNNQKIALQAIAGSTQTHKTITIARLTNQEKKDQIEALQKKHQITTAQKQTAGRGGRGGMTSTRGRGAPKGPRKTVAPEIVTLSSDDDDDSSEASKSKSNSMLKQQEKQVLKKSFEPEIVDDVVADTFERKSVTEFDGKEEKISTTISCRTIRIGSYKFDSKEKVNITNKGIQIVAPSLKDKDLVVLNIQQSEIIKVVTHYSKQLQIIFLYTKPSTARYIVEQLQLSTSSDNKMTHFSPLSPNEPQRKIVFLAENVTEENRSTIKSIYDTLILEEISNKDANEMLVRSTGIALMTSGHSSNNNSIVSNTNESSVTVQEIEIKKLFIYPPGRGGIPVTTNDYFCLASDVYLNDTIIDFYLKYLFDEVLTAEQRDRTYIFNSFFYTILTRVRKKEEQKLTAAQKRHSRVASWTKNVNIFDKDFIIIPINEQSHWFLAIICYPNLTEPHTMDTDQPIKLIPIQKRTHKKPAVQIGSTTITPLSKKEETIKVLDDEDERDEAEGDDSDLGSDLGSEEEEVIDNGQPVKVPCILIFDSLLGAPRNRVVATLRDYLTCEHRAKFPNQQPLRQYSKLNIFGNQVKVPQQNNFTDCGLFLLQYVEQFFKDPIKDFRIPIKLVNWFHQDLVTRKREQIANLLKEILKRDNPEGIELPEIELPTKNGQILETSEENAFDDDEYVPTAEDLKELSQNGSKSQPEETKRIFYSRKRNLDKSSDLNNEISPKTPRLNARNKS